MREEEIPVVTGKGQGNTHKDGTEVIFEGSDGTLCSIAAMYMWVHQLVGATIICDGLAKCGT